MAQQDGITRTEVAIAVFVDFENLALGVQDMKGARFEIELVLKRSCRSSTATASRWWTSPRPR